MSTQEKKAYEKIYNRFFKRLIDIVVSGLMLIVILPLILVIFCLVWIFDGFPVFYRAERGGYLGRPFQICKFRTMVQNADQIGGGTTSLHDTRITKIGYFLRKTKLDELPQIGQVFLGKMSFIGPRPELMYYVNQYKGEELDILKVRPGITDYSSLEFINLDEIVGTENPDEVYEQVVLKRKNQLRVYYAHNVSLRTDLIIFFKTIHAVVEKILGFVFGSKHR